MCLRVKPWVCDTLVVVSPYLSVKRFLQHLYLFQSFVVMISPVCVFVYSVTLWWALTSSLTFPLHASVAHTWASGYFCVWRWDLVLLCHLCYIWSPLCTGWTGQLQKKNKNWKTRFVADLLTSDALFQLDSVDISVWVWLPCTLHFTTYCIWQDEHFFCTFPFKCRRNTLECFNHFQMQNVTLKWSHPMKFSFLPVLWFCKLMFLCMYKFIFKLLFPTWTISKSNGEELSFV